MSEGEKEKQRVRQYVAALRSGQFAQVSQRLHVAGEGYCCLGVACDVAINNGLVLLRERVRYNQEIRTTYINADGVEGSATVLPATVVDWYGFRRQDPDLLVPGKVIKELPRSALAAIWTPDGRFKATVLNDAHGLSFARIADCFEYTFLREDWDKAHGETAS